MPVPQCPDPGVLPAPLSVTTRGSRQAVQDAMALPALEAQVHVVLDLAWAHPEKVDARSEVVDKRRRADH
eukprot:6401247-Pyramimonas_sp.AAC.1